MRSFLIVTSMLYAFIVPRSSQAQLQICNQTTVLVDISIAYPQNGSWFSHGWFRTPPSSCAVVVQTISSSYYYFYAAEVGGRSREWQGNRPFCISQLKGFTLAEAGCAGLGIETRFIKIDVGTHKSYTLPLGCLNCPKALVKNDPSASWDQLDTPTRQSPPDTPYDLIELGEDSSEQSLESKQPNFKLANSSSLSGKLKWQQDLDWCSNNHDALGVHCADQYLSDYPECYLSGGRACLMGKARNSARAGDCSNALKLAVQCQCHNSPAMTGLYNAGAGDVCKYLGPPDQAGAQPSAPPPISSGSQVPASGGAFYVMRRYTCARSNGEASGSLDKMTHSSVSCQDARNELDRLADVDGDVCRQNKGPDRHTVSVEDRTAGGPCYQSASQEPSIQ